MTTNIHLQKPVLFILVFILSLNAAPRPRDVFREYIWVDSQHAWNWPQHLIYGVILRVYYADTKPHPAGRIVAPLSNGAIPDEVLIKAEATPTPGTTIQRLEFLGHYQGFNYEGDGNYTQWHYHFLRDQLKQHIGVASSSPYNVTWNHQWFGIGRAWNGSELSRDCGICEIQG